MGGYIALCAAGSLVLLFEIQPLSAMSVQLFGHIIPNLSDAQRTTFLWVLLGGPACFTLTYAAFDWVLVRNSISLQFGTRDIGHSRALAIGLFILLGIIACKSIVFGGALYAISSWNDYNAWINARWKIYSQLGFFEFVNIYMWLPTTTALLTLLYRPQTWLGVCLRWAPILLLIIIDLLLFQKRPVILSILTVSGVLVVSRIIKHPGRANRYVLLGFGGIVGATLVYTLIALAPTLLNHTRSEPAQKLDQQTATSLGFIQENATPNSATQEPPSLPKVASAPAEAVHYEVSPPLYTLLSLMMRGAGPALHYIAVFPDLHPFYKIDIGQDSIVGGEMPDDNKVVWRYMYPEMPGTVTASANFVLYSQGGILVALFGMATIGAILATCWHFILHSQGAPNLRSLAGITLLLFVLHLTVDSLRASLIVSYGFGWAFALLFTVFGIEQIAQALASRGQPTR